MKRFGFFPLPSNDIKDGRTALAYYRNKDLIERFDYPARKWQCGEVTKKQADLYAAFSVTPPNVL